MKYIYKKYNEIFEISNSIQLKCFTIKGYEYEIECWLLNDGHEQFIKVIYNIDNGYNQPDKEISKLIEQLKDKFSKPVQLSLFDRKLLKEEV